MPYVGPVPKTDLLTTAQAAERRGVNVRTIHRAVASGRLAPAMKLPGDTGAYLFRPSDVDAVALQTMVPAVAPRGAA